MGFLWLQRVWCMKRPVSSAATLRAISIISGVFSFAKEKFFPHVL